MSKISRYNYDLHKLEWVDASVEDYEAWKAKRAESRARTRATSHKKAASITSETLEDSTGPAPGPTGPARKGGPNTKPESILAPALPRLAEALAQLTHRASHAVTGGRAPMTRQEATFVAVPTVRILDRTAARYVKATGVVTPNQEDAAIIVVTVAMWLLGWLIAVLTNKPRQIGVTGVGTTGEQFQAEMQGDLYAGSEPAGPSQTVATGAGKSQAAAPAADEADLFSGSEPLATDGSAPVASAAAARLNPMADAVWAALSPTDRGEALAG